MEYLLLLLGFSLLIFSGWILITCSESLALRLNLSQFLIGVTVVAVGTSAPELLVSLTGAIKGYQDVAIYNVVGSNISNVLLVLAIAVIILPVSVNMSTVWFNGLAMIFFSLLFGVFILDLDLSSLEGILLLSCLLVFIILSVYRSRNRVAEVPEIPARKIKSWLAVAGILGASGGLALGADLLVDNAVLVARKFSISDRIISVSLVAVGTSIPELTTSAMAALSKKAALSIGNIMGSNIFNIGLVLGLTSIIHPLQANPLLLGLDLYWFVGIAVFLLALILLPPRLVLSRWKGLVMLSGYLVYLYLILK